MSFLCTKTMPDLKAMSLYRNIPFGVALRLRRICGRDDWFDEQLKEFKQFSVNVDDIITTSSTKVLTELETLHVLIHFYLKLSAKC